MGAGGSSEVVKFPLGICSSSSTTVIFSPEKEKQTPNDGFYWIVLNSSFSLRKHSQGDKNGKVEHRQVFGLCEICSFYFTGRSPLKASITTTWYDTIKQLIVL